MDTPASPSQPKPALRPGTGTPPPWVRVADWTVGVTAGVLLLIALGGWLYHRTQLADIAADHLRLQVSGPAKLRPGMTNQYSVRTTSVAGNPISAQVEFALYSADGVLLPAHNEKTDENGHLTVTIPADLEVSGAARLEISARHEGREEKVVTRVAVEPVRYAAHLTLDKPLYRPGETIRYRAWTLSRFGLAADRDLPVEFEILDPAGAPVAGSQGAQITRQGIACGRFPISEELPGGKYTLVARSDRGAFPDERRGFFIRRCRLPRLNTRLGFPRNSYAPGEEVVADVTVERIQDGPAAGAQVTVVATVDGQRVHEESAQVSEHGTVHVEFALPEQIERADGRLAVTADDGAVRETVVKTIPIHLGPVEISFYPEGGDLVAGLETRVYFRARDASGAPVDVRGTLVDSAGQRLAGVATIHRGMGTFSINDPRAGRQYRLELEDFPEGQQPLRLPRVWTDGKVVLSTGLGVFPDGSPLEFHVRASEAGLPLVAQAWCRGLPVGQKVFVTGEAETAKPVAIPLDDEAHGVIRLTVYDYRTTPPETVAERLVFRRSARRLRLEIEEPSAVPSPAEEIELSVSATDEAGQPLSAVLGADLVDQAPLALAGENAATLPGHMLLATEIDNPQELDDPDRYLAESREAAVALDLLLGTQGRRRFPQESLPGLDQARGDDGPLNRLAALGARAHPPAMFDNLMELQQQYKENLAKYRAQRNWASNTLTALSFLGGVGLLILVAMLSLLNVAGGPRHWGTAVAVATICLLVGGILMDPGRWRSLPEGAVPYAPFDMAPVAPAPDAEKQEKTEQGADQEEPGQADNHAPGPMPGVFASDSEGRGQIRFDAPGRPGSYRVLVDGHDGGGRIGSTSGELLTRVPFRLEPILPPEVSPGDRIGVPLAVLNNTDGNLLVELVLEHGELVRLQDDPTVKLDLKPKERTRRHFPLEVTGQKGTCRLLFRGIADQLADEAACSLEIVPSGMPADTPSGDSIDAAACPLRLSTELDQNEVAWGGSVGLVARLTNVSDQGQPTAVAVLGLPAGLEAPLDQLEQLTRSGKIDYYQTRAREVICHWRTLQPNQQIELKLDLIAAVPGQFSGPASYAYLADAAEQRHWNEPLAVAITRE